MRNATEQFVSDIVLSITYNNETDGDCQFGNGFFGMMKFDDIEEVGDIDGIHVPDEFSDKFVIGYQNSDGVIRYDVFDDEDMARDHYNQLRDNFYLEQHDDFE